MKAKINNITKLFLLGVALVVAAPNANAYYFNLQRDYEVAVTEDNFHEDFFWFAESSEHEAIGDSYDEDGNLGDYLYYDNQIDELEMYWGVTANSYFLYYKQLAYLNPAFFYDYYTEGLEYYEAYSDLAEYKYEYYDSSTQDYVYSSDSDSTLELLYARDEALDAYFDEVDDSSLILYSAALDCALQSDDFVDNWYTLAEYQYEYWSYFEAPYYALSAYYYFLSEYADAAGDTAVELMYAYYSYDLASGAISYSTSGDVFEEGGAYDVETLEDDYEEIAELYEVYDGYYAALANYYEE